MINIVKLYSKNICVINNRNVISPKIGSDSTPIVL